MLPRVHRQGTKDEHGMASASRVSRCPTTLETKQYCNASETSSNCCKIVVNRGSQKELRIRRLDDLRKVVKFFKDFQLQAKKNNDFQIFDCLVRAMGNREHLTGEGLTKIAKMA